MTEETQIHVRLLDEMVDVWRPVRAECLRGDTYRILDTPPDETERWEFEFGAVVECQMVDVHEGQILAATKVSGCA